MELFIIRHGQSANNALADLQEREVDPPLTGLGERQADALAAYLAGGEIHDLSATATRNTSYVPRHGFGITSLFSSPMYRSLQTVEPVSRSLGLAPQVWIDIHEEGGMYLNHGDVEGLFGYPGRTRLEMLAEFPDYHLPLGVSEAGWWNQGHEEPSGLAARAGRVTEQLMEMADSEGRVAMITHGGFINALLQALLGQPPGGAIYFRHHNTAITRISMNAGERTEVLYLNRVDHLQPHEIS